MFQRYSCFSFSGEQRTEVTTERNDDEWLSQMIHSLSQNGRECVCYADDLKPLCGLLPPMCAIPTHHWTWPDEPEDVRQPPSWCHTPGHATTCCHATPWHVIIHWCTPPLPTDRKWQPLWPDTSFAFHFFWKLKFMLKEASVLQSVLSVAWVAVCSLISAFHFLKSKALG